MAQVGIDVDTGARARRMRRARDGYLFLLPTLLLIGVFTLIPFVQGIMLSFQEWDGVARDLPFVGLRNYERVLGDSIFWASLRNAALFGLIGFLAGNALSLAMALAVNANPRGSTFFRIVYYLPVVFSVVVVGMMFSWILQPSVGLINRVLDVIGQAGLKHNWLNDPSTALPTVSAVYVWHYWGLGFLLFLAGLQHIPRELYEAAEIDGAGTWQSFRHITWPQLTPMTTIISILTMLYALQIFATVQLLTNGGPGYHTEVPTLRIYKEAFEFQRFGSAAAMSVIFGAILIALSVAQLGLSRRFGSEVE